MGIYCTVSRSPRSLFSCALCYSLPQARHDFNVSSSPQLVQGVTGVDVSVETYGGAPIDVELPAFVSGQHVVNFLLRVDGGGDGRVQAELTLPVHLRYPELSCERRGQDCETHAWVEVGEEQIGNMIWL